MKQTKKLQTPISEQARHRITIHIKCLVSIYAINNRFRIDEFTHHLSSRGTEAPQLRYCHYSCCMLKHLRLISPLFPSPRSLLQVFPTPKMRPCSSSILYSVCLFFFLFFLGVIPPSTGASSFAFPQITFTCLFVALIFLRMSCASIYLFRGSIVTTDQWLVVTSLIDNRGKKALVLHVFLGHQKARRSFRERERE